MKSKWVKGLLFLVIAILIVGAVKATMFFGSGHPYMKQMTGEFSQLQQKFHSGMNQVSPRMEIRGQMHDGKYQHQEAT